MKKSLPGLLALIAAIAPCAQFLVAAQPQTVRQYREAHEHEIIGELNGLLAIPNVASDTENIRRNASRLIELMTKRGIQSRLLEGNGPPAVFGELKAPGASVTVGFYAHYDGQPVDVHADLEKRVDGVRG
jgi:acetylornithine deacetylase/succinyl-diaminopimelate desuccinylase-like protein